jgi:hypothetical protein
MNYRTVTDEQLRTERVRLTNIIQLTERRRDASTVNRGGRDAGFRRPATTHQQERELVQLRAQLERLDKELAWRADHAKPAAEQSPAAADS